MRAYIFLFCFLVFLALMQMGLAENRQAQPTVLTKTIYYVAGPNETAHAMDLYIPPNATKKTITTGLIRARWCLGRWF